MANSVYANARASVLQTNLLSVDRINRMIEASSVDEAIKVLAEINFGDNISISSPLEFEKLIAVEEEKLFDFIKTSSPKECFKKFILYKNDYHNAEVFIKAKHLKVDVENMLVCEGIYSNEVLKDKIFSDDYSSFPSSLANALRFADGEFVSNKATGVAIGGAFIKALYNELFILSKADKYLKEVYYTKVDCINVGVALRLRNYAQAVEFFIPNGRLTNLDLRNLCENSLDELKSTFVYSPIKDIILRAIEEAGNKKPLSQFEKLSDYYPVSLIKKNEYSSSGNIPFLKYVFNKLNDLTNVRIILVGLINGFSQQDIKNRIRW